MATPTRTSNIKFPLSVPGSWLSVYVAQSTGHVGIFLSSAKNTTGRIAMQAIVEDFSAIKDELAGNAMLDNGLYITDWIQARPLEQQGERPRAFSWLAERVNTFVRVLRPRMRSAAADYESKA